MHSFYFLSAAVLPKMAFRSIPAARSGVGALPAGTFCPKAVFALIPQPGYFFSDGHAVSEVLSMDELPYTYT